jgi:hypothetical protein
VRSHEASSGPGRRQRELSLWKELPAAFAEAGSWASPRCREYAPAGPTLSVNGLHHSSKLAQQACQFVLLTDGMRIDRDMSVADTRVEALSKVPLFSSLSGRQLRKLSKSALEDRYVEGAVVVHQGGRTETMFVILEGTVRIVRDGRTIARRSVGEFFGEIAVIDGRPRAGTVIAETPLRCVVFYRRALKEMVIEEPQAAWSMLEALASRVREK